MSRVSSIPIIDPFALPSETTGRFRMLVVFTLVATWGLVAQWIEVPNFMLRGDEVPADTQELLTQAVLEGIAALSIEDQIRLASFSEEHPTFNTFSRQLPRASLSLILLAALLTGATKVRGIVRMRRAARYPSLREVGDGRAVREIRFLAREAAGIEELSIHSKPGLLDGLAFGVEGQEAIVLAGRPDRLERGWSDLNRAVVLHELGHWTNRDVQRQEWVRGLLVALSAFSVVTLLGSSVIRERSFLQSLGEGLQLLLILAVAWSLWAGWVRARETGADWRVVSWGYGEALQKRLSLQQAFGSPPTPLKSKSRLGWLADRVRQLGDLLPWRFHPTNRVRLFALCNPEKVFAVRSELAAISGLSLALLISHMGTIAMDVLIPMGLLASPFLFSPVFVVAFPLILAGTATVFVSGPTYLLAGTLGNQVLRDCLAREAGGHPPRPFAGLMGTALIFAASLEVGLWVFSGRAPASGQELLQVFVWTSLVGLLLRCWMGFVALWSRRFLARWRGQDAPRGMVRFLHAASACALSLLLWPLLLLRALIVAASDPSLSSRILGSAILSSEEELGVLITVASLLWIVSSALALGSVFLAFGVGYLALATQGSKCEFCDRPYNQPVVGQTCPGCGERLAPWADFQTRPPGLSSEMPTEVNK